MHDLAALCGSLVTLLSGDPLAVNAVDGTPPRNKTTVGLMMRNNCVEDLVVGGPAFNSQHIHRGDQLLMVNGHTVRPSVDSVSKLITGDDLVGSTVTLRMMKLNGTTLDVDLVRMPPDRIGARRKIHEHLQNLRQAAVTARDGATASRVDTLVNHWHQMMNDEAQMEGLLASGARSKWHQAQALAGELQSCIERLSLRSSLSRANAIFASPKPDAAASFSL